MDPKTWHSRKRSLNKSINLNNEAQISLKGNDEKLPYEKEATVEEIVKNLHEQVAYLLCECNAKDKLMAEHAKTAQGADTGRERAKAAALKLEQDRRVNLERAYKILESKYKEARKKLANLTVENARLTKTLFKKEEIIKNVSNQMSEATTEFNSLVSRLDSTERGNNILKHEYRVLEKELKMKNKNRRADVAKLEAERQKLRLLARRRIPSHAKTKPNNFIPKAVDRRMSLMMNQLCAVEEENRSLKENKENEIRLLKGELEAKLLESEEKIGSLKMELECLEESKRTTEDHFENLRLINVDLDHKLFDAKLKIKEAMQNVSFLEMELEDRSHYCEGLEASLLELQLQFHLASVCGKDKVTEDFEEERTASVAECTTDKAQSTSITAELTNNKKSTEHSSLRDQMAAEDDLKSPVIKEIISTTTGTEEAYVPCRDSCNASKVVPRALPIVPSKKRHKGIDLLKKLLFRRKRGSKKKKKKLLALLNRMQI